MYFFFNFIVMHLKYDTQDTIEDTKVKRWNRMQKIPISHHINESRCMIVSGPKTKCNKGEHHCMIRNSPRSIAVLNNNLYLPAWPAVGEKKDTKDTKSVNFKGICVLCINFLPCVFAFQENKAILVISILKHVFFLIS